MKYFSMFSGIGGFDLALNRQGHECIGYSEIDKHAISIYKKNFGTGVKNHGDATRIIPEGLPDFDLLCGGFPCQAFSLAGKRRGLEDTRGTLFYEIARIAAAKKPKYLLLENVKGLLSHAKGETFSLVLKTFSELWYSLEWGVVNTRYFGVPQNRERVFIVGSLGERSGCQVFPVGQDAGEVQDVSGEEKTILAHYGHKDKEPVEMFVSPTLKAESHNHEPMIISPTITTENAHMYGNNVTPGQTMAIAKCDNLRYDDYNNKITGEIIGAVRPTFSNESLGNGCKILNYTTSKLRRLTPKECERLQAFPDGWTAEGIDDKGNVVKISDTQRYKCLGNAVTVKVVEEIVKRIGQ